MREVHVVPDQDGWVIKVDGEQRHTFSTQHEAITRGIELASDAGGELVIHGMNGHIREKVSHGNDPRTIPG